MAIARTTRPQVIVVGDATRIRELRTKSEQRLYAHEVALQQDHGATVAVQVYIREASPVTLPAIGEQWAIVAEVDESAQYGASLTYQSHAADALDRLLSGVK